MDGLSRGRRTEFNVSVGNNAVPPGSLTIIGYVQRLFTMYTRLGYMSRYSKDWQERSTVQLCYVVYS